MPCGVGVVGCRCALVCFVMGYDDVLHRMCVNIMRSALLRFCCVVVVMCCMCVVFCCGVLYFVALRCVAFFRVVICCGLSRIMRVVIVCCA